ncbi:MAG: hypothetical protein SPI15_06460, partial [Candidatus Faecousia sp.]|nr:hypothetical protein [Candidatus Faecousia sp.]
MRRLRCGVWAKKPAAAFSRIRKPAEGRISFQTGGAISLRKGFVKQHNEKGKTVIANQCAHWLAMTVFLFV